LLAPGQKRQSPLIAQRFEDVAIDPARFADLTVALCNDTITLLFQLPAAASTAELRSAIQQHDRRRAVRPDIKIKRGSTHADRSGGRHDLIG
jgi:hypothetical protein